MLRLAVLLVLTAVLFAPGFQNQFVFDDDSIIVRGEVIHDWKHATELFLQPAMYANSEQRGKQRAVDTYRPLTMLTFFWDASLSGREPWSYHLTNLLAHLACVALVFALAKRMLGRTDERWALLAATWFTLTPLAQAAHIWINGRSDLFCTLFGCSAILLWLQSYDEGRSQRMRLVLVSFSALTFFAALLCKETWLGVLPALMAFPHRGQQQLHRANERVRACLGFVAAAAAYLILRSSVLMGMRTHESGATLQTALTRVPTLWLDAAFELLVPTRVYLRCLYYDYQNLTALQLGGAALLVLLLGTLLVGRRAHFSLQVWAALWLAGTLAPVAIISTMIWPGFGRYLYVPAIGVAVALADLVARCAESNWRGRRWLAPALGGYFVLLVLRVHGWVADYHDAEKLFSAAIRQDPGSPHGYGWLGMWRNAHGDPRGAIGPLEQAYARDPNSSKYLESLADAYLRTGLVKKAQGAALIGLEREPLASYRMIVLNTTHLTQPERAAQQIAECLRQHPGDADCTNAARDLVSRHPRAADYRTLLLPLSHERRYAALRAALEQSPR